MEVAIRVPRNLKRAYDIMATTVDLRTNSNSPVTQIDRFIQEELNGKHVLTSFHKLYINRKQMNKIYDFFAI